MSLLFADDKALARRLVGGDEEAFGHFFDEYAPRLYRFALIRLNHDEDRAEEIVQTTLVRALGKLRTYRGEARLFTWLCTFCRREISACFRRRQPPTRSWDLVADDVEVLAALELAGMALGEDPEERVLRGELGGVVRETLDSLPARYGDALEWKYVDGLTVDEIARRLAITTVAAQSLLARARRSFRDAFVTAARAFASPAVRQRLEETRS